MQIFERHEGDLLAFRTDGIVNAPLRQVAAALLDYKHTTEWVDHLVEETVVKRLNPAQFLEYTHVGTPFVIRDRDFLCQVTITVDRQAKSLTIESHSVEDPSGPTTKYVRGKVVHNEFRLTPAAGGKTRLEGEFHVDAMGSVPKWIVNMFQHSWPKSAFRAIQKRVDTGKSQIPAALEEVVKPIDQF